MGIGHIPDASTFALWRMDEASGVAVDAVAGRTLTEQSGAIGTAAGTTGSARNFGNSPPRHFSGPADSALCAVFGGNYTVEVWLNFNGTVGTANQNIFGLLSVVPDLLGSGIDTLGRFGTYGQAAAGSITTQIANTVQWHHIAIRRTGTTVELFLDGVKLSTATISTFTPPGNATIYFGSYPGNTETFRGLMDEVVISSVARPDDYLVNAYVGGAFGLVAAPPADPVAPADPPEIAFVNPGSTIAVDEPIGATVTPAADTELAQVIITASHEGLDELVYDGAFAHAYGDSSVTGDTTTGLAFTIVRGLNWYGDVDIDVHATSNGGGGAEDTGAFLVPDGEGIPVQLPPDPEPLPINNSPLMDLSHVVMAYAQTYQLKRRTEGGYDADGIATPTTVTWSTIRATWQPLTGRELSNLPEGMRGEELRYLWTDAALRTQDATNQPDSIMLGTEEWQVQKSDPWGMLGNYTRVLIKRIGAR